MTYEKWIKEVDTLLLDTIMFDHDDIPDYDWFSCFKAGDTPEDAFESWKEDDTYGMAAMY